MLSKIGATQWTIGKLMTVVLLVIVLALVAYGVSTKGLNPLIERAGGMFDSVQILFGFGDDSGVESDCASYFEDLEGVGKGEVTLCQGSCNIKFEEGLSFGNEFNLTGEDLFVKEDSQWRRIFDFIDNLPLAIKERGVNKILMKDYESYIGLSKDNLFMGSGVVSIYILIKGDLGGRRYFKWEEGSWFEERDNIWEEGNWKNDFEFLNEIYSEANDFFFNPDDEVFYRVGDSGARMIDSYFVESKEHVYSEDIGAGEDSYELLNIFEGDSGQIDSSNDFQIFQEWFSSEKKKIKENQKVLNEEMKVVEELLSSDSLGDFEGEPYYLFLVGNSDGEGVFYLKTSSDKYGLKGESLRLFKGDEEGEWKSSESSPRLFEITDEDFEEKIKIHKIRKFLELRC